MCNGALSAWRTHGDVVHGVVEIVGGEDEGRDQVRAVAHG